MVNTDLIIRISEILPYIGIGGIIGGIITHFFEGYFTHYFDLHALERTHNQRIVEKMTEKFHEYTESYYMPLVSSSSNLAEQIEKMRQSDFSEIEQRKTFHYLALFLSQRSYTISKLHGFFLKDISSEIVITKLLDKIFNFFETAKYLSDDDLSKIAKETDPNEIFIDFSGKIDNQLCSIFKEFKNWINEERNDWSKLYAYFKCFSILLLYEVNEPYGAWYGRKVSYILPDDLKIVKMIIEEQLNEKIIDSSVAKSIQKKYKLREIT